MLNVQNVYKSYRKQGSLLGKSQLQVLSGVSFEIQAGECVGLIGESGSGKSTLSRLIMDLEKPDEGSITYEGKTIKAWKKKNPGQLSVVFQDYTTSVNPRFTLEKIIAEPMLVQNRDKNIQTEVTQLLERVGLSSQLLNRYPHELSGGQLQRVCIARAISTKPRFIVLDEALSSLDVSVQAQILDLLKELKNDLNLTYLFVAHDLQAVAYLCDKVLFLYQGRIEEQIQVADLAYTQNSYAKQLLSSVIAFEA
ncbi:ABC transporter ATP-binding protein [Geosporobacter ferrireducens]|uniref:Peptide ABC transporter ATP-binding protein n=1 Tax=Geosporobacter ferrireducens TaxID=1424294 RepID=A0A1D8GL50_9FIRM|nr:dipeptide/oligopeptide/nickel ABC transporter ATP-binding protein [Geosporobacter ferrireducens]AOT71619.1 peptide ABC transporter ATP-binding protein [Geosporobacter ferrireducens]MTI55383.1 ABC transporter ATP-binding protein [Geosporobacter ferrireducens]